MSLTRREWALLVLAAADGKPLKKIDFQKALFLIGKLLPEHVGPNYFAFVPHKFGPFSKGVYLATEQLVFEDLATEEPQEFTATHGGLEQAKHIRVDSTVADVVARTVAWVRKQPFEILCQNIYQHFPEMKENSVMPLLPPDPKRMPLVEWFDALSPEDRRELDRAASLGKTTSGDLELELALSGKGTSRR